MVFDLQRLIRQFSQRPFVRSVVTIASGTAAGQAIAMAFSPIITRLFGPEIYGLQGVFTSVGSILATLAALSYPTAIVLPKNDLDALALARLSIYIGIAISGLAILLLTYFGSELLAVLNAEQINDFIYLLPLYMMGSVVSAVMTYWLIRRQAFKLTAGVGVLNNLLIGVIKTGLGLLYPTAKSLITVTSLSGLIGAIMMIVGLRQRGSLNKSDSIESQKSVWQLAKDHYDFALFRTPRNLLEVISLSLPVMMLSIYFGPVAVGHYVIAATVLAMPARFVGQAVVLVFYPRITMAINEGQDARGLIAKATLGLAITGLIPFGLVALLGPVLFAFVFGADWAVAGIYAQWLSIWLFFEYIAKPTVWAIPALRLQRELLIFEIFNTGLKVFALYLGYIIFQTDIMAIALFSIFGVIAYICLMIWVMLYSKDQIS